MEKGHNDPTYFVGYRFNNKQGYSAEIIEYTNNKNIVVKFDGSDELLKATGLKIKNGYPMHPTIGKPQVGDQFPCKDGDVVEIVEYKSAVKVLVKWMSDGAEKWTEISTLRKGVNKHPYNWKFKEGDVVHTKNNGEVLVVEYRSATDVLVKFECGEEKSVTAHDLRAGYVRPDGKFSSRKGYKFTTNSGWNGEVILWNNAHEVKVRWQDGSEGYTSWSDIENGGIKPLFQPSDAGIGYVGDGRYLPKSYKLGSTGKQHADEIVYQYWQRMITRCYSKEEQAKPSGKAYIGCTVSEDWHNFQNFAEWAKEADNCGSVDESGKVWHLDKDILIIGNREYGVGRCLFVPNEINVFFSETEVGNTGYLGVNYIKPATKGSKQGYIARCHFAGERKYLGYYDTPKLAYKAYRDAKIEAAKELADKWVGKVDDRVIFALCHFGDRLPVDI